MKSLVIPCSVIAAAGLATSGCDSGKQKDARIDELERQTDNLTNENDRLLDRITAYEKADSAGEVKRLQEEIAGLNRQIGKLEGKVADYDRLTNDLAILRAKAAAAAATPPPPAPTPAPVAPEAKPATTEPAAAAKTANGIEDAEGKVRPEISNAVVVIEGDKSVGTGFMVRDGAAVYLYTAAHVLSGNSKLTVKDSVGRQFTRFSGIEVAEKADLVRLKLDEPHHRPLELAPTDEELPIQTEVAALGNGGGLGVVAVERGQILGTSGETLEIDAGVIQGNSGGPLLTITNGRVVGLVTHLTARRNDLWSEGTRQAEVRRFACRVNQPRKWTAMPVATFMADGRAVAAYDEATLLGYAVSRLEPSASGLRYSTLVYGNKEALTVISRNRDNPLVLELIKLNTDLSSGRLRLGEADRNKRIKSIVSSLRSRLDASKQSLNPDLLNPYHRALGSDSLGARDGAMRDLESLANSLR